MVKEANSYQSFEDAHTPAGLVFDPTSAPIIQTFNVEKKRSRNSGDASPSASDSPSKMAPFTSYTSDNFPISGMDPEDSEYEEMQTSSMPSTSKYATGMTSAGSLSSTSSILQSASTSGESLSTRAGRRKIDIKFIEDKARRHITFSKRKAGIMKKAYELSTLTGTQVLLLVASESGHVFTFATPKLQPLITKQEGKNLIQTCLNAPDPTEQQAHLQAAAVGANASPLQQPANSPPRHTNQMVPFCQ